MYARAVDDAAARLRALRQAECGDLGLAVLALGLAVAVTQVHPALAPPLFLGGLTVGVLGLGALWHRWDLVERLAGERDAQIIPEVRAYARRESTIERRKTFTAMIRSELQRPSRPSGPRIDAVANELATLADELEDDALTLDRLGGGLHAAAQRRRRLRALRSERPYGGSALTNLPDPGRVRSLGRAGQLSAS